MLFLPFQLLSSTASSSLSHFSRRQTTAAESHAPSSLEGSVYKGRENENIAQTRYSSSGGGVSGNSRTSEHPPTSPTRHHRRRRREAEEKVKKEEEELAVVVGGGGDKKAEEERVITTGTKTVPDQTEDSRKRMVAACAPSSSAAAASYQKGFTIFGDCEKQQPLATAASDHQNSNKTVKMTAVMVEQLRQQLQLVVENDDLSAAVACIGQLENAILSKETLEATRIGRFVNDIRKQTALQWPDFAKRCRALIKQWQKIAEYRPSSSCEGSSNGGTPQLVSPALRRGLTPRTTTPGKRSTPQQQQLHQQRVISTELQLPAEARQITGPSSSISPVENGIAASGGSYAPLPQQSALRKKISPQLATIVEQHQQFLHKSASVGATLCHLESGKAGGGRGSQQPRETVLNGIVFVVETSTGGEPSTCSPASAMTLTEVESTVVAAQSQNAPLTLKLKRSASGVVQRMTSVTNNNNNGDAKATITAQQQSVHAARKDVQSTAMLVAQLSEALPQHIGIDLGTNTTNASIKWEEAPAPAAEQKVIARVSPDLPVSTHQQDMQSAAKRRSHTHKGGRDALDEAKEGTIIKQFKVENEETGTAKASVKEEKAEMKETKKGRGRKKKDEQSTTPSKFNWFSEYPLTAGDDLPSTSTGDEHGTKMELEQARAVPTRSFVLPARDRQVVLLPYVDVGQPDWKTHALPHPERFLFPDPGEWTSVPPQHKPF